MKAQTYSKAVYEETGWWGTFPVDIPLEVGDVLEQNQEGRMTRVAKIKTWGVAFPIDSEPVTAAANWSHHATRTQAATAAGGATAATGVGAEAAIKVSFSEVAGFVLDYVAGKYNRINDVSAAQRAVLGLAKNGQWKPDYVLVTELVEAIFGAKFQYRFEREHCPSGQYSGYQPRRSKVRIFLYLID